MSVVDTSTMQVREVPNSPIIVVERKGPVEKKLCKWEDISKRHKLGKEKREVYVTSGDRNRVVHVGLDHEHKGFNHAEIQFKEGVAKVPECVWEVLQNNPKFHVG